MRTNVTEVRRVLHVKGRRTVRATEVEMDWRMFNKGDIFIVEIENVRLLQTLVAFFTRRFDKRFSIGV